MMYGPAIAGLCFYFGTLASCEFARQDHIQHESGHVKQHLEQEIDVSKMTPEQVQFHYFSMFDTDKSGTLDGNELIAALVHNHEEGGGADRQMTEAELEENVDSLLKNDDRNDDGLIDYAEFVRMTGSQVGHDPEPTEPPAA